MEKDTAHKYSKIAKLYDMLEWPIEVLVFKRLRKEAVSYAYGHILEVGIGTGKNLPYYKKNIILAAGLMTVGLLATDFLQMSIAELNAERSSVSAQEKNAYKAEVQKRVKAMDAEHRYGSSSGEGSMKQHRYGSGSGSGGGGKRKGGGGGKR